MKRNSLKKAAALAVCAFALAGSAANAQMTSLETYNGSFHVDRFGVEGGRVVAYGRLVPSSIESSFDHSRLGAWTGIGTGYGESGVESRSNMTSDNDGPISYSLVRPSDDGLDIRMGATSANDRTSLDVRMGATSANDRTEIDASFGPTSENDRTGIDLKFGPTSGNDRVAGGPIDLHVGPTSGNDRTQIDASVGATSGNDRTEIDANFGPTSENDRTSIDLNVGPTSGNDRTADGLSVSSSSVIVPVTVVSASCDAVSLSFGGSSPVIVTSSEYDRSDLCAVADANMSGSSLMLTQELNDLVVVD